MINLKRTMRHALTISALAALSGLAQAQTPAQTQAATAASEASPVAHVASSMPWEYGALIQGGNGLTENRGSFHFIMAGARLGKVLTPEIGKGLLRGNFEYAVEVFPFWQSYTPYFQRNNCAVLASAPGTMVCSAPFTVGGTFTGVSITPIMLRWNLTHARRWMPWAQAAGGVLWTNHKYPAFGGPPAYSGATNTGALNDDGPNADASVFNFTPQGGVGFHYFLHPKRTIDFSANAVHISSASLGDRNPGVNASVQFSLGYSWWK